MKTNINDILKILYHHFLINKLPVKQSKLQHLIGKITGDYEITLHDREPGFNNVCGYWYINPIDILIKLSNNEKSYRLYHSRINLTKFFIKEFINIAKSEIKYKIRKKLGFELDE